MSALLVGYARCSTDAQDLTAQRDALLGLGVEAERIYVDHRLADLDARSSWSSDSSRRRIGLRTVPVRDRQARAHLLPEPEEG